MIEQRPTPSILQATMEIGMILDKYEVEIKAEQCGVYMTINDGTDGVIIDGDTITHQSIIELLREV